MDPSSTAHFRGSLLLCCIALSLLVGACDRSSGDSEKDRQRQAEARRQQELERLRSTGYLDSADIGEGEGRGVVHRDAERSCPGYNLYAIRKLCRAELVDEDGKLFRSWSYSPSRTWEHCELLPNGDLLVVGSEPGGLPDGARPAAIGDSARYALRFNWDGELLWKRDLQVHHDIEVTPGGNLLVLAFERRLEPRIHPSIKIRDDHLMLLSPKGEVLNSQSMLDAVRAGGDVFPLEPVGPCDLGGEPWVDLFHSNSVEWMRHGHLRGMHPIFDAGNVLVSFRYQDCIAVFDWDENKVVWSWGRGQIFGPHDAQVLDNGHILLFDNGLGRTPAYSRVVEMDPVTGKIVWEYRADPPETFYTESKGSAQRLPNGNTLIAESDKGHAFEVTPSGDVVWEFFCAHELAEGKRAAIVRMKRFPRSFVEELVKNRGETGGTKPDSTRVKL